MKAYSESSKRAPWHVVVAMLICGIPFSHLSLARDSVLPAQGKLEVPRYSLPQDSEINAKIGGYRGEVADVLGRVDEASITPSKVPDVSVLPKPDIAKIDLDDLASNMIEGMDIKQPPNTGGDLIVFVSESMPKDVLKEYSRQAEHFGGTLAVRGFRGGLTQATKRLSHIQGEYGAPWMIHPEGFKQFKVTHVPTIVLADSSASSVLEDGCAQESDYAAIVGDVSIEQALRLMRSKGSETIAKFAAERLRLAKRDMVGIKGERR